MSELHEIRDRNSHYIGIIETLKSLDSPSIGGDQAIIDRDTLLTLLDKGAKLIWPLQWENGQEGGCLYCGYNDIQAGHAKDCELNEWLKAVRG